MTEPQEFKINIIGERINPGFKSSKIFFDNEDIAGLQGLALKQAQAGAWYLDINIGARALTDSAFMAEVIRAIQAVVTTPLAFDFPSAQVQEVCLETYDRARAGGQMPMINSITEHRWDLMDLHKHFGPFKVIAMASERVEEGIAKGNKTADEIYRTAKRCALRLRNEYGMAMDDILIDVSVSAIIADTAGLNRSTLDAIKLIGNDPDLAGTHRMGGLTNIAQQMPKKAADGSELKHSLESAFLTLAVPYGFDTIIGTPWKRHQPLPEDNYVLKTYKNFLEQTGSNALRAVRKFYKA
ncbi:MAG: dihydropteroate synthase [Acidobacteriia bacterium]|nr:dihydropteroate synthase [Terriglobia bacterium]